MMEKQRTLLYPIAARGTSLHAGGAANLTLHPANEDTGVIFRRVDLSPPVLIPGLTQHVSSAKRCTTLSLNGAEISTVEHLMSAFACFGIDNVLVDIDCPELPAMDGSAADFVMMLKSAGLKLQDAPKRFIRIKREVEVRDGDKWAKVYPADDFELRFAVLFDDGTEFDSGLFKFSTNNFLQEICRARTFGFKHEVEGLRKLGLIQGGSLDNAVVVDQGKVVNKDGLRRPKELVMHKLLDAIGDLSLLGRGLIGGFQAYKSGHELNHSLLKKLLEEETDAWCEETFSGREGNYSPINYDFFPRQPN